MGEPGQQQVGRQWAVWFWFSQRPAISEPIAAALGLWGYRKYSERLFAAQHAVGPTKLEARVQGAA